MAGDALDGVIETLDLDEPEKRFLHSRWLATLRHLERDARRLRRGRRALRLVGACGALVSVVLLAVGLSSTSVARPAMWAALGLGIVVALAIGAETVGPFDRWRDDARTAEALKVAGWEFAELTGTYATFESHAAAFRTFAAQVDGLVEPPELTVYAASLGSSPDAADVPKLRVRFKGGTVHYSKIGTVSSSAAEGKAFAGRLRAAALAGVVPADVRAPELPPVEPPPPVAEPPLVEPAAPEPEPTPAPSASAATGSSGSTEPESDEVGCTVFAPPSAAPGETILVQVFVHLPEAADAARTVAEELDTAARRRAFRSLEAPIRAGSRLDFELQLPGLAIDDPVASLVWRQRTEAVQFGVTVPPDAPARSVIGTVSISVDSAPVGHVKFKLAIEPTATEAPSEPQGEEAHRYRFAFISYASKDRAEVLRRVQLLSAVGIRYFQDVLSLEPGDRWTQRIELGIDECDLFLLFWSSDAKGSEWVRQEVQYALTRKAGDDLTPPEIRPVIIEGPPIVKPWDELAHLHFNDRLLYFLRPSP
jgi:hypothetical protein